MELGMDMLFEEGGSSVGGEDEKLLGAGLVAGEPPAPVDGEGALDDAPGVGVGIPGAAYGADAVRGGDEGAGAPQKEWDAPRARVNRAHSLPVSVPWPARFAQEEAHENSAGDSASDAELAEQYTPVSVLRGTACAPIPRPRAVSEAPGFVPPHTLAAQSLGAHASESGWLHGGKLYTFSQVEGRGRKLTGRDVQAVRTAVMRQSGFLDNHDRAFA